MFESFKKLCLNLYIAHYTYALYITHTTRCTRVDRLPLPTRRDNLLPSEQALLYCLLNKLKHKIQ